jgi:dihydrofolate reductase
METNIIVASNKNRLIGIGNVIPWHSKNDMEFFRIQTTGEGNNAIIMGNVTYKTLYAKNITLLNRKIIVITHDIKDSIIRSQYKLVPPNVVFFNDINNVINLCKFLKYDKVFIAGGLQIYNHFWNDVRIKTIYHTEIKIETDFDLPEISEIKTNDTRHYIDKIPQNYILTNAVEFNDCIIREYNNTNYKI